MPPFIELIVVVVIMMVAFFTVFLMIFLLALFLAPIERSLSKMIWANTSPPVPVAPRGSFKDFSKKHI
jgi:hypothetical protein